MLNKLKGFSIDNFFPRWVCIVLSDTKLRVKGVDVLSEVLDVWAAVPQGTKLGVFISL